MTRTLTSAPRGFCPIGKRLAVVRSCSSTHALGRQCLFSKCRNDQEMRSWATLGIVTTLVGAWVAPCRALGQEGRADVSSARQLIEFVEKNPRASMDEAIGALSPEIRSQFLLVFDSKSPIGAEPLTPRVILANQDATEIFAFAGSGSMRRGNQLELASFDPESKRPILKLIKFEPGRDVRVEHSPRACGSCHGLGPGSNETRHIWSTYPDWPGVYGQSHNGNYFQRLEGKNSGTSMLPTPAFEQELFARWKESAPGRERYRHLLGIDVPDVYDLAERNLQFGMKLSKLNAERISHRVLVGRAGSGNPRVLAPAASEDRVVAGAQRFYQDKLDHYRRLIGRYGTAADRALFLSSESVSLNLPGQPDRMRITPHEAHADFADEMSALIAQLRSRNLEYRDLALTRELESYVYVTGSYDTLPNAVSSRLNALFAESLGCSPAGLRETIRKTLGD